MSDDASMHGLSALQRPNLSAEAAEQCFRVYVIAEIALALGKVLT
jgi:hypothetical protein